MKLKPIIQELRAHCPGFEGRVFGVGTFSRLDESVAAELLPAAFVIPVSEDPEEPAVINRYKQQVRFKQRKDYHYYRCPQCGQQLRVPRGRGKISITCPKCGHQFIKKS